MIRNGAGVQALTFPILTENPTMPTLKELTDAHHALREAANVYWVEHIEPRVLACKTRAELRAVQDDVSIECTGERGQIREMPGNFAVNFALALSGLPEDEAVAKPPKTSRG